MAMTGMDIAQVQALAKQFTSQADAIEQLTKQLTSALQNTTWVGADRTAFESEWTGTYVNQLTQVATALRNASTKATQNATEQEQASAR